MVKTEESQPRGRGFISIPAGTNYCMKRYKSSHQKTVFNEKNYLYNKFNIVIV